MPQKARRSKADHTAKTAKKLVKINDLKKLRKIREKVAGIDIGSETNFVAFPDLGNEGKICVYRYGTFTKNLQECVESLVNNNVESVAMEATGVYWMTLYSMLEEAGIEVVLVNARDFKKMKDKKTDVCDAEFLQLYHSYGLFEGAFVPPKDIKALRTYVRARNQIITDLAATIQRMQKALIEMNLRLENVFNDITGVTAMAIIRNILNGKRDAKELAKLRDPRCKKSEEEIADSLQGFYTEEHLFNLKKAVERYDFYIAEIESYDKAIETHLEKFSDAELQEDEVLENNSFITTKGTSKRRQRRTHEFSFDLEKALKRITGFDLTKLPGVGLSTALTLISEVGLDMKQWPSCKHFVSWLRLAPNNRVSGGKILGKGSRKNKSKAAIALRMAASSLYREKNETAIGAFFRRKRAQIGAGKAVTAAAAKIARAYYMLLTTGKPFEEPGAEAYMALQQEKYLRNTKRRLAKTGHVVLSADEYAKLKEKT